MVEMKPVSSRLNANFYFFPVEGTCSVAVVFFDVTLACLKIIGQSRTKTFLFVGNWPKFTFCQLFTVIFFFNYSNREWPR